MNKPSAYELIRSNIGVDGKLPHTFSLEEKPAPNQLGFLPGAMDGIGMFHVGKEEERKAVKRVVKLLEKHFKTGDGQYITQIESILTDTRAISIIDPILENLRAKHKRLDANRVFEASRTLVKTSGNIELIKICLGLLGLFDLGNEEKLSEIVTTLARYDDFTLYALAAVSNWTNGNQLIFQIAQHVVGWGKIYAVERLEPENETIRDWILRDGCSNGIMNAYLGLICAEKGDLISALRQETLDDALFAGVSILIDAMLDEGPAPGISAYEHAEEALDLYLRHAKGHVSRVEHLWRIVNLRDWAEGAHKSEISAECETIIGASDWKEKLISAIERQEDTFVFFCACNVASRLDIDVSQEFFAVVKKDLLQYYAHIPQLFKNPGMADEIIRLCENTLPLDEMAEGMGDYLFAEAYNQEHQCLDFVLPALAAHPMQGSKLIKTGLNSPVVRGRNMACRALSGWVKELGKPLSDISPELYAELVRIHEIEVNEQTKETMKKLIDGGYESA